MIFSFVSIPFQKEVVDLFQSVLLFGKLHSCLSDLNIAWDKITCKQLSYYVQGICHIVSLNIFSETSSMKLCKRKKIDSGIIFHLYLGGFSHLVHLPLSPSLCSVKFFEVCHNCFHSCWPSNLRGMTLSQTDQSDTSSVEKSKLSFQSFAVIAVSAIGKLPPVLSVWENLRFFSSNVSRCGYAPSETI